MEHRSPTLVAGLIAALMLPVGAGATGADWQARQDKAAALQAEAKALQAQADQVFQEKSEACRDKFLVNDCRKDAKREHVQRTQAARRLDNEGKALEREVRKEQVASRTAERDAEATQRAAQLPQRETETAAARQADEARIAGTLSKKEKQAVDGERRKTADAEAQRRKVAAYEARVAEQKRRAERKAAVEAKKADQRP